MDSLVGLLVSFRHTVRFGFFSSESRVGCWEIWASPRNLQGRAPFACAQKTTTPHGTPRSGKIGKLRIESVILGGLGSAFCFFSPPIRGGFVYCIASRPIQPRHFRRPIQSGHPSRSIQRGRSSQSISPSQACRANRSRKSRLPIHTMNTSHPIQPSGSNHSGQYSRSMKTILSTKPIHPIASRKYSHHIQTSMAS